MNYLKKYKGCLLGAVLIFCTLVLNAQKITGWKNLVSDNSLSGWKKLGGAGIFTVENGVIIGTAVTDTANTFLVTEKEYGDFILELDVMMESTLSNSGIQTRSHFGGKEHPNKVYGRQMELDPSARKWAGGIYDEDRREWLYPLTLNLPAKEAFKVGKYNHIKIECIGNEMKTWVNKIPAAHLIDTLDSSGFIGLQVHAAGDVEAPGTKVYFKNIKIKTSGLKPSEFPGAIHLVNTAEVKK